MNNQKAYSGRISFFLLVLIILSVSISGCRQKDDAGIRKVVTKRIIIPRDVKAEPGEMISFSSLIIPVEGVKEMDWLLLSFAVEVSPNSRDLKRDVLKTRMLVYQRGRELLKAKTRPVSFGEFKLFLENLLKKEVFGEDMKKLFIAEYFSV